MGKKSMAESSSAHSHKKKQHLINRNLQIKFLKPRVYITDSWNFKSLVQELTGNHGGCPVSVPAPAPVMDDVSFESSEASAPATSFESYDYSTGPCMNRPDFNTLESWLLETTTADMRYDDVYVPMMAQEEDVSVYDYDLSFSSQDFSVLLLELQR
nr:VQ motif containing protein [Ipomoea batatas]